MKYRLLGKTGISVSQMGIGTWGMGSMWGPRDDAAALAALLAAFGHGINFIDTAHAYGNGHSERLIAKARKESGESPFTATKIPPKNREWPARGTCPIDEVFPPDWIVEMTEASLRNLNAETIDLQQLHVWSPHWLQDLSWLQAIEKLKTQGKIRFFGVSLNDHAPASGLDLVKSGLVDTIQVIYNIFDQSPEDELLPLCREYGVGVIARVPFDEGSLTGTLSPETVFHKSDWRRFYFSGNRLRETCERVAQIKKDCCGGGESLAELALRFCLSHDAVSTVIPGMRKVSHVEENCRALERGDLTNSDRNRLAKYKWIRNFYEEEKLP